jgi:hypothetical protein
VAVALLALALAAPAAMAGNGNGNGQGQGHGKPAGAGAARGHGQEQKAEKQAKKQAKHEQKAKHEKKVKPDKAPKSERNGGDDADDESQDGPVAPVVGAAHGRGGLNFLLTLPCKAGGWQTLQRADGTRFDNQGRCVSYAVRGGLVAAVVPAVTISFVPTLDVVDSCDATATLADFDPAGAWSGELWIDGVLSGLVAVTADGLGDASVPLGAFTIDQTVELKVDGITSGPIVVACPVEVEEP